MFYSDEWDTLFKGKNAKVSPESNSVVAEFVESFDRATNSYGEYYEGDGEVSVIFKVNDRYYQKFGYRSSYDHECNWDGKVVEVFPEEKVILTFRAKPV